MSSAEIFEMLSGAIGENKAVAKKINGVFQWKLQNPGSEWVVDFKNATVSKGTASGKVDVTLTLKDKDFIALMTGKANGQQLFMSGKIKFKGNMGMVMKLGELQKLLPK